MTIRKLQVPLIVALFLFNACGMQKTGGVTHDLSDKSCCSPPSARYKTSGNRFRFVEKQNTELLPPRGRVAIRAIGQHSASGLMRRVQVNPVNCPQIEWSWRVDHP
jgi:hypothetical protein